MEARGTRVFKKKLPLSKKHPLSAYTLMDRRRCMEAREACTLAALDAGTYWQALTVGRTRVNPSVSPHGGDPERPCVRVFVR